MYAAVRCDARSKRNYRLSRALAWTDWQQQTATGIAAPVRASSDRLRIVLGAGGLHGKDSLSFIRLTVMFPACDDGDEACEDMGDGAANTVLARQRATARELVWPGRGQKGVGAATGDRIWGCPTARRWN